MFATLLLAFTGCAPPIHGAYSEARLAALSDPADLVENWIPESVVYLDGALVQSLVKGLLDEALTQKGQSFERSLPLGVTATLKPALSVNRLEFSSNSRCPTCFSVDAMLSGPLYWTVGNHRGSIPAQLAVDTDFFIRSSWEEDGSRLELILSEIRHIEAGSGQFRGISPKGEVAQWAHARMVESAKPIYLGTVGGAELPLADIRVLPAKAGVRIELATNAPARTAIETPSPALSGDWIGGVSTGTLLSLIRKAAFEMGEITLDVHADPRRLSVEGDTFQLGLRIWRLTGRGWWRDYRVSGTITANAHRIRFIPETVEELEHSPRAGVVDPLALLAKGKLLEAVEAGCSQVIPIPKKTSIGSQVLRMNVESVQGIDDVVWLSGTANQSKAKGSSDSSQPPKREPKRPTTPKVGTPPK